MDDKRITKDDNPKPDDNAKVKQEEKQPKVEPVKVAKPKKTILIFRENRTFEAKFGREFYRFEGRKEVVVQKDVLKNPDFIRIKKLFIVREV